MAVKSVTVGRKLKSLEDNTVNLLIFTNFNNSAHKFLPQFTAVGNKNQLLFTNFYSSARKKLKMSDFKVLFFGLSTKKHQRQTLRFGTISIQKMTRKSRMAMQLKTLYEESVVDKFKSNLLLMIIWLSILNYNS